jgi:hypothetical protein
MTRLAMLSLLSVGIAARETQYGIGLVLTDRRDSGASVLLGADGNELRADAMPVFRLSTDGEAEDGNIVEQYWDLSRIEAGIGPILLNHSVRNSAPLGLGQWRSPAISDWESTAADGRKLKGRSLLASADFSPDVPDARLAASMVRSGHLRSTSVGWRPGGSMLRGDLPKDHPRYREARTDECGTRIEGRIMGTEGDPNRFIEASVTPVPSDPNAVDVRAWAQLEQLGRGEEVRGLDLRRTLLALRDAPGVEAWASARAEALLRSPAGELILAGAVDRYLRTDDGAALLRSILSSSPPPQVADRSLRSRFARS